MLVKIENPIKENMDYSLNEQQCNELMSKITKILESEDSLNKAINEAGAEIVLVGAGAVLTIIGMIKAWIQNKYRMNVSKIISQSKELNDLYEKVAYIISHDKKARFKHRNDMIDCETMDVILMDEKDPRKRYKITLDLLGYDPKYFMDEIESIMNYINKYSEDKKHDYANMKANLLQIIDDGFNEKHWYVDSCKPIFKNQKFNVRLEKALVIFKNAFGNKYYNTALFNEVVSQQMSIMHYIEQAYNRMLNLYGKDRDGKALTDEVFKKLLGNITKSMNFNNSIMEAIEESIKFYIKQIEKMYDIIRS